MQYSIFQTPWLAFYSKSFYNDTARTGKGTGFLYLFLILLVSSLVSTVSAYFWFLTVLDSPGATEIVAKLPDLNVRHGVLSINKPSPYKMEFENATTRVKTVILFDTTGKSTLTDEARALVTDKGIIFEGSQDKIIPWSQIAAAWSQVASEIAPITGQAPRANNDDFDFPAARFKDAMKFVILFISAGAFLCLPFVWLGHVMLAFIYGIVGKVMDRHKLGFVTALRMASRAMTPSIVLTTLYYVLLGKPENFLLLLLWELLTVPLTLGYLFFGYSSIRDSAADVPT